MKNQISEQLPTITDSEAARIATEAFEYGLPLVLMNITMAQNTYTSNPSPGVAPINQFRNLSSFPSASDTQVVRPNCDTFYSTAFLDLSEQPLVLNVPATGDTYYMLPMLDAYTNVNQASLGKRQGDVNGGEYLIVGPAGVPEGLDTIPSKIISCTTNMVWIVGRFQVNNPDTDGQTVIGLQADLALTPLSEWDSNYTPPTVPPTIRPYSRPNSAPNGEPNSIVKDMSIIDFFDQMNQLLALYPPPTDESAILQTFAAIGVGPAASETFYDFYHNADDTLKSSLDNVIKSTLSKLKSIGTNSDDSNTNGWTVSAIPTMGNYGKHYTQRAWIAYLGLGANLIEDAVYSSITKDLNGDALEGGNTYKITFPENQLPPVYAFWSLTIYNSDGYFIDNPINRYAVGHSTQYPLDGLPDGPVTITLQNIPDGSSSNPTDYSNNLLPIPATGNFNVLLRTYWPEDAIIDSLDTNNPDRWIPPSFIKQ